MARSNPIQDGLVRLADIQDAPASPEGEKILRAALAKSPGLVVDKAARLVARVACGPELDPPPTEPQYEEILDESWTRVFCPLLAAAFDRLLANPGKDPGTFGKASLLHALNRMQYPEPEPFLKGVVCQQFEPQMGGKVDRAPPVRAESVMGLVRVHHPDRFRHITDLLWDDCQDARLGAVRAALAEHGEIAEMILRAKANAGDKGDDFPMPPPEHDGGAAVLGEIFNALLAMGGERNVSFVLKFFRDDAQTQHVREQAAMALGQSRLASALESLSSAWDEVVEPEEKERILFAVALNGTDTAMGVLAEWIDAAPQRVGESYRRIVYSIYSPSNPRLAKLLPP